MFQNIRKSIDLLRGCRTTRNKGRRDQPDLPSRMQRQKWGLSDSAAAGVITMGLLAWLYRDDLPLAIIATALGTTLFIVRSRSFFAKVWESAAGKALYALLALSSLQASNIMSAYCIQQFVQIKPEQLPNAQRALTAAFVIVSWFILIWICAVCLFTFLGVRSLIAIAKSLIYLVSIQAHVRETIHNFAFFITALSFLLLLSPATFAHLNMLRG